MFFITPIHFFPLLIQLCFSFHLSKNLRSWDESIVSKTVNEKGKDLEDEKLFQGDIIMDKRLKRVVFGGTSKREILDESTFLWLNGTVYYEIDASVSVMSKKLLKEAIKQFERRTCIRFRRRQNEKDYVVFISRRSYCSSYVGRFGGAQPVYIGEFCLRLGSFEHEIMHVLGFIHEHSREDRDEYIDIHFENIEKKFYNDFKKFRIIDPKEEFNFASIMMYENKAFSKNGKATIEAIGNDQLRFGQRTKFSVGDINEINRLYNCKSYINHPQYDGLIESYHGPSKRKDAIARRKMNRENEQELKEILDRFEKLQGNI